MRLLEEKLVIDPARGLWSLRWIECECGFPDCPGAMLLARPPDRHLWVGMSRGALFEAERKLETAIACLLDDGEFREAVAALAEVYGWPWHLLDDELAAALYERMLESPQDVMDELRFWGPVGARGFRRLTGNSPTSCEEALRLVRAYRHDTGGGRITSGPLAR